jgi:hypothetical protein
MAQTVSRQPLTAMARVSPCKIFGQRGTESGFAPNSSVFPCQYHSTMALYNHKLHHLGYKQSMAADQRQHQLIDINNNYK